MSCDKWVPVTKALRFLRLRMEERPPIWRVAANKLNKQSRTADRGWSSNLGVGRGANNSSPWKPMLWNTHKARFFLWRQNNPDVNYFPTRISGGGVFLEEAPRSKQRKRDIFLGTWNVRSLYRAGSLTAVARELSRYKLDLVGVQEDRWDTGGTVRQGPIILSIEKEMKIISWEQDFLYTEE